MIIIIIIIDRCYCNEQVAGTGKSLVTKKIVEDAKLCKKEVAVAAPTGVAAVNLGPELGAQTVHSLAGIGEYYLRFY